MIALYVGIYRIAVGLHRRSVVQRERSIACLVSMAGGAVTQLGSAIGMTRAPDGHRPPPAADAPAEAAVDRRHHPDDDDEEEDDDETAPVASRLPTLLFPTTSFALFGRLGACRRENTSGCHKTTTVTTLPASSTKMSPPLGRGVVGNEQSLSSAMSWSDRSSRTADVSGEQPSPARRQKRDAASTVSARPEDLYDLPYFDDDDDVDDRRLNAAVKSSETRDVATSSAINEQRVVRFVAATDDVDVTRHSLSVRRQDTVLPQPSCNGGRRAAARSTSSSHWQQQQRHRFTPAYVSHVWRHTVVHKEGQHTETRLETVSEPGERQALLAASCPRHGGCDVRFRTCWFM